MRLIDKEKLIAEYDRVHIGPPGGARKLMKEAEDVPAIPLDWINNYINWLNSISTVMAATDVNAIKSMLTKWKLDNNGPVCGPDYCEIGGTHNE